MVKKWLACFLALVLLSGCAIANPYLFRDKPNLVTPARKLAEDYLEGQKKGETYGEASKKYGRGVVVFYGLKDYRYLDSQHDTQIPFLQYRIQATNQMGGVLWNSYSIWFSYDEKLMSQEPYDGLSIAGVVERLD